MHDMFRATQFFILIVLTVSGCRTAGVPDVCVQKISRRLLDEMKEAPPGDARYRVVVRLSDSAGVKNSVPALVIDTKAVATGSLTAEEIRRLCVLEQVEFIDLPKQYHPLEQHEGNL